MIKIGKSYVVYEEAHARLCADILVDEICFTLWFAVNRSQEKYLSVGSADAFVMTILPLAICEWEERHEIHCEDPVSARLCYQLENYLIPALSLKTQDYAEKNIWAELRVDPWMNDRAVGTGWGGPEDVNSLYTIMQHGKESEYPLTHITVFNIAVSDRQNIENDFQKKCRQAKQFANEQNLKTVFVDTNLKEVFHGKYIKMGSFYNIACALALQGLFSVYVLSAEYDVVKFKLERENAARYDLLTVGCVSTESLSFHLSGAEMGKDERGQIVSRWLETSLVCKLGVDKRMRRESLPSIRKRKKEGIGRKRTIKIGRPYMVRILEEVRLCSAVELNGIKCTMWFSVKESYGMYLVDDRVDAFVIALLTTAMHNAVDIVCDAPVTRRLLYQINHYLIPMMSLSMGEFHPIVVNAEPVDKVLECEGAVVTGWTGGVDSMFTYMQNVNCADPAFRLTHLMIANNGAIIGDTRETFRKMIAKAENGFAVETGLPVIGIDTNLQEILDENFLAVSAMRHAAVIAALQKLFHVFLESSTYNFSEFSFCAENMAYYEMMILKCFETDTTVFFSSGGAFSRIQKLKKMISFPLAQRYLHPCIYALRDNCCQCEKCIRTEVALYGMDGLDRFAGVFDVDKFEKEKDWYFAKVLIKKELTDYRDALQLIVEKKLDLSGAQTIVATLHNDDDRKWKKLIYWIFYRIQKWVKRRLL